MEPPTSSRYLLPESAPVVPLPHPASFRREGEYWSLSIGSRTCRFRHSRGMGMLWWLLAHPGERVPAVQLVTVRSGGGCPSPPKPLLDPDRRAREQARINATRALKNAVQRIDLHLPELGRHLQVCLRTGNHCAYLPDPLAPLTWVL
jgi:hypothetical protein